MNQEELDQLHGYLNGTLGESEFARLQALLRASAEARRMLRDLSTVDAKLQELAATNLANLDLLVAPIGRPARMAWLSWRPFMAAAAGLVIGLFSASMVWGYVGPYAGRAITLWQEGFESGAPPLVTGIPVEPGHWSGDYSEVIGASSGVSPASGNKMLRMVRADYEGKPSRDGYAADLYRIVDLRGSEFDVSRGEACVSVEAHFRSLPQGQLGRIQCGVAIHALDALPNPAERHDFLLKRRDGFPVETTGGQGPITSILATAARHEVLETAGGSWQVTRTELRVPAAARYCLVHLYAAMMDRRGQEAPQPIEFAGLFVDDIRATLTHRPALP